MTVKKKFGRLLKLSRMTASVAGKYLGARLIDSLSGESQNDQNTNNLHRWAGHRIAKTLGELKGPLMKLGQMASISSGFLPKEVSDALSVLQRNVPFVSFETVSKQIEQELGDSPEVLFYSFEKKPFASASIGQVHRAVLDDGRHVAVKIQYPEIEDYINTDLFQLRFVLKASGLAESSHRFDQFFEEIKVQLKKELDYCNEADNLRQFGHFHNTLHPYIRIPKVIGERSSAKILTMTFEQGESFNDAAKYTQKIRDLIGTRLVECLYGQILKAGAFHADPNPANFAFDQNGNIIFYDFGNIKKLTENEQRGIASILRGILDYDPHLTAIGFQQVGMLEDGPLSVSQGVFETAVRILAPAVKSNTPFDFGSSQIHRDVINLWPKIKQCAPLFQLTSTMVMLQRVNVGTYGNLRKLNASVPIREVIENLLNSK